MEVTWLHNFPLHIQRHKPSSTNFTDLLIWWASHFILIFFSCLFSRWSQQIAGAIYFTYKSVFPLYFHTN